MQPEDKPPGPAPTIVTPAADAASATEGGDGSKSLPSSRRSSMSEGRQRAPTQPDNTETYLVGAKDTLAGVAVKFNTTVAALRSLNKLYSNQVFPGQRLFVPREGATVDAGKSEAVAPPAAPTAAPAKSDAAARPALPPRFVPAPPVVTTSVATAVARPSSPVTFTKDDMVLVEKPPAEAEEEIESSPSATSEYVKLKTPTGTIPGTVNVTNRHVVFMPENKDACHPVVIAMDGVKSCKVTADPTKRPTAPTDDAHMAPVILRIEVKEPSWMMWKSSPIRIYEFVVPQDKFRTLYDPIVEYASLEHSAAATAQPNSWTSGWFSSSRKGTADAASSVLSNLRLTLRRNGSAVAVVPTRSRSISSAPAHVIDSDSTARRVDGDGEDVDAPEESLSDLDEPEIASVGIHSKSTSAVSKPIDAAHRTSSGHSHSAPSSPPELADDLRQRLQRQMSVMPELTPPSRILTPFQTQLMCGFLPANLSLADWTLVYSTAVHGISINTMYANLHKYGGPSIFVFRDMRGHVFGAFASECVRIQSHFYGTGETFVFRLKPDIEFFQWTRKNDFFIYACLQSFSFGGGSNFALWVDADLLHGNSQYCETFENTTLSSAPDFEIAIMEVWGFDIDFST